MDRDHSSHAVQFYEDDGVLCDRVTDFVVDGLRQGIPAIVIASEVHRAAIRQRLADRAIDVTAARTSGRLTILDARQTLVQFCDDKGPDGTRFETVIGKAFDEIMRVTCAKHVRAYGEMVDLLWQDGRQRDALRLEQLWNDLATTRRFALLCGYAIHPFCDRAGIDAVCRLHSHVYPITRSAKALAAELAHRDLVERSLRDATRGLRRAEQEARESRDELESFLDDAPIPIHTTDVRGVITWANRAELALLGYAFDDYVGRHLSTFHADPTVATEVLARAAAGTPIDELETRLIARDGSIRHVVIKTSIQRSDGAPVATRCFSRDVTDRKRAELEREASIAELTRTVRLNETLAGVVAHDLRNPLNTIIMGGEMVLDRVEDPNVVRPLRRILGSATRMQRMIEQLLDLSRVRMGTGIPLEHAPTDVGVVIRDAIDEIRTGHPTREIRFACDGDLRGELDPNRLAQVFSNLIGNAVEHASDDSAIDVAVDATRADWVRVEVANRGVIPSHILAVLFAPFRGSHRRGPKSQGLGLGLFISEQIVRAHGGTIEVSSSDDMTRLVVVLPRRAAPTHLAPFDDFHPAIALDTLERSDVGEASLETYRLIVDNVRDCALCMLDPRGFVASWSAGARAINGYTADEVIGRHFSMFSRREDVRAGVCDRELDIAAREGQFEDFGWRVRKDGTLFWSRVAITAIRDDTGALAGYTTMTRDLTEERHASELARQNEERFRLLVASVEEYAIFMLDPDGHVATWNAGAHRIKGYRADEIIGTHFSAFYPAEDVHKTERELELAVRDGRFEEEGWRVRKDGTRFWASVVITAVRDASGDLVGFAKVTRDLTDRRRHEDERLRLAQAQEAVRLRDEFLSIVSHELRTPLTVMRLQIEALAERLADSGDVLARSRADRTLRASQRLDAMVETVLDVTRLASGRFELRVEDCDLGVLVREVVSTMVDAAATAGCPVRCSIDDGIAGRWDRGRIEQLVTNLLSNALKYAAGTAIDVLVGRDERDAVIEVRDHGPGLPVGPTEQLFERFERASSMRDHGGLGLGLYVVRQIAEAHAGSAVAVNASDGGACFRVKLPIVQQATKALSA